MMTLCDDKHDEVCFETRNCPVCEKMGEIEKLEDKIQALTDEVKDLEERI